MLVTLTYTDGLWNDDIMSVPDELNSFSYAWFLYKSESIGNYGGCFDEKECTLTVPSEHLDDDKTLLHEMIHLHEFVINRLPMFYHDMLLWALYLDLKIKIPQLDEIITDHAHLLNETDLYNRGGTHDVLFLLKSFELDIQMNYSLGTVFAYGRKKWFKEYTYFKDGQVDSET